MKRLLVAALLLPLATPAVAQIITYDGTMTGTMVTQTPVMTCPPCGVTYGPPTPVTATVVEQVNRATGTVTTTLSNYTGAAAGFAPVTSTEPLAGKSYSGNGQTGNISDTVKGTLLGTNTSGTYSQQAIAGGNGYTINGTFTAKDPPAVKLAPATPVVTIPPPRPSPTLLMKPDASLHVVNPATGATKPYPDLKALTAQANAAAIHARSGGVPAGVPTGLPGGHPHGKK